MKAENSVRLVDVWVGVRDPRQAKKVEHPLVELLVVAVCAVLSGADTFVAVEVWGKEKLDWLRKYLKLESGIPCHDTFGRVFAAIDPDEFGAAFLRWVGQGVPTLTNGEVVAIDGKTITYTGDTEWVDGREVEREDCHPRTVGDLGPGRLHRHHRCHGHAAQHCASHSRSGCRLCPGGQG